MTNRTPVLLAAFTLLWGGAKDTLTFDSAKPGALPPGWTVAATHDGAPPRWLVVEDRSAPSTPYVLAQTSADKQPNRYAIAVFQKAVFRDGDVSVYFKPVSGTEDQSGGVVFRYRDENNYYVVRANALEGNIVMYKVLNGRRVPLAPRGKPADTCGVRHRVPTRAWNLLHVRIRGNRFRVYYDHYQVFEVVDASLTGPGKAGVWTRADSVTYFDDFQVRY